MAQILVVKPGTLTRADKAKLRKVDVVCVETLYPADVRLIGIEGSPMGNSDLFYAAIHALNHGGSSYDQRQVFVKVLAELATESRSQRDES